jgi:hypothetical protein
MCHRDFLFNVIDHVHTNVKSETSAAMTKHVEHAGMILHPLVLQFMTASAQILFVRRGLLILFGARPHGLFRMFAPTRKQGIAARQPCACCG